MFAFISLLTIIVVIIIIFYAIQKRRMTILERNGINGPKPHWIFGNIFHFFNADNVTRSQQYIEKYGKTCGYYVGHKPNILTIDIELIKRFQIKDFEKFSDRQNFGIKHGIHPNPRFARDLVDSIGFRWKETRTILTPTFSAMKLKMVTPIMESAIDIFIDKVGQQAQKGTEFNIFEYFQLLTADVISKTALGIDTNVQYNPKNEFFLAAKLLFDRKPSKFLMMFMCFPELDRILYPFRRLLEVINERFGWSPPFTIAKLVEAAIQLRKIRPIKIIDLLQLMLDAKASEDEIKNENASKLSIEMSNDDKILTNGNETSGVENGHHRMMNGKKLRNSKSLTEDEVISNAVLFYEAGYETTSTALGFIAHFLVTRQDIQDKVREEVNELYANEKKFDYNTVNKLAYMQCVINESMRYYPPVTAFITRNTREDYHYKDMIIPKDSTIRIPTYQLHHCEEYWPNPEVFDPERFRDKKNYDPNAFQVFGNGPRNCIGMRFALYEIKLALAKLLHRYILVPGPSTENELTLERKIITETPKYGVFVKALPILEK
ncbi:Thromboxane-A synthase [Dermatophagoides farinae]|uniref:Cytochrome p450-like protein 1 n=1 Tax=Dermatophagoides farinae TaxID=6954 RepID=A0A922HXJ1_DERFA|nr:cytochrome p450-like protein 1 [Dermatophagoides farinae]KAH9510732.1 Thromboxane-A synthase [Dermatophagoides farinae]